MALRGKLHAEIDIKAAADKFYNMYLSTIHLFPSICSDQIQAIELLEGEWETVGSVRFWKYTVDGIAMSAKETVEAVYEENRTIKFNILDGDIMMFYKSVKATICVTAKEEGSLVKWTMDYEKLNEDAPNPDVYLNFAVKIIKDVDAHLVNVAKGSL